MKHRLSYTNHQKLDSEANFLCIKLHKVDGLVQHIAHMMQNVVRHYVCETVIATSSELGIGRT